MSVITGWVLPTWAIVGGIWLVAFSIVGAISHADWTDERGRSYPNGERTAAARAAFLWGLGMAALAPVWPLVTIGYLGKFIGATYREVKIALAEEVDEGFLVRVQKRAQEKRDHR